MNFSPRTALIAAVAALSLCGPALAEPAVPIAAPAARAGEAGDCRFLAPRYESKLRERAQTPVRFQGGARLTRPVAAPCRRAPRDMDA